MLSLVETSWHSIFLVTSISGEAVNLMAVSNAKCLFLFSLFCHAKHGWFIPGAWSISLQVWCWNSWVVRHDCATMCPQTAKIWFLSLGITSTGITVWGYWLDVSFSIPNGWSLYPPPSVTGNFFFKCFFMAILPSACKGNAAGSSVRRPSSLSLSFFVIQHCTSLFGFMQKSSFWHEGGSIWEEACMCALRDSWSVVVHIDYAQRPTDHQLLFFIFHTCDWPLDR